MPDTGLKNSPLLIKGAIVQLIEDIIGIVPNVIPFQVQPDPVELSARTMESRSRRIRRNEAVRRRPFSRSIRRKVSRWSWSLMRRMTWRTATS